MEEINKGGRPKNTALEAMRTTAWLTYLMRRTKAKEFEDLTRELFKVPSNRTLSAFKDFRKMPNIRWDRYASHDTNPSKSMLNRIEQSELGRGSKAVFDYGPEEAGEVVYLWCVFELDLDAMWQPIADVCGDLSEWRRRGMPFSKMIERIAQPVMPSEEWGKLDFKDPATHLTEINAVVKAYHDGYFTPSLKRLAATMAMWRIALYRGESMAQMEYLVRGLLAEPCKKLLSGYGIYSQFKFAFHQMEIHDLILRGELELAKKQLEKLKTPSLKPVTLLAPHST